MTLHLGTSHAHNRNAQQQQDIRDAKRELKNKTRNDWDYPPLPAFQLPVRRRQLAEDEDEERIAGFRFHTPTHYRTSVVSNGITSILGFEPLEWRERNYSSEDSADEGSVATASSGGSKKSSYKFEGPDSVGAQIRDRKAAKKRKRQQLLDEEVTWNDGLAHWLARRDAWCGAYTSQQVQVLEASKQGDTTSISASASITSSPRTSTSTASSSKDSVAVSTPSTTPELVSEQSVIHTRPPVPQSELLIPLAPTLLANHPVRRRITPDTYPEIYQKIILQSRSPSVPINLSVLIKALVQGWKDDGEWPPKVGPVEKSIGRKKNGAHESALKSGVKAVGRVLRITGGESTVGNTKDKG